MPIPKKNESEEDFVSRCIPIVLKDESASSQDQAVAMCHSIFKQHEEKSTEIQHNSFGGDMERRTFAAELRVDPPAYGKRNATIRGYAAKFNTLSEAMPIEQNGKKVLFREQLMPGCFASAIPVSDVRSLFNHDPNLIMGRTTSGTLRIKEDETGLYFENDPPDTTYSRDLQISMSRGDVNQCSFGFNVSEGGDTWARDSERAGCLIRSIHKIERLWDASPVTYPAYVDTSCALRSMVSNFKDEEIEEAKRKAEEAEEQRKFEMEQLELELKLAEIEL